MAQSIRAIGIAWYRQEDYPAVLGMFVDANNLPRSWKEWLRKAEGVEKQIVRDGAIVERVYIDPDSFPGWCAVRGMDIDA
jgi:hypothetical protein